MQILAGGQSGYLHRKLVVEQQKAVAVGGWYHSTTCDTTRALLYAVPAEGVSLEEIEKAVEQTLSDFAKEGLDDKSLARAKTRLVADAFYAQDSQTAMARMFGSALAVGAKVQDVLDWPSAIDAVTREDVMSALHWLDHSKSVSGYLLKDEAA